MMAVSDADILGWLNANPGADDTLIANTMRDAGVSPEQMALATNTNLADVQSRYNTALGIGSLPAAASAPAATVDYFAQQFGEDTYAPVDTYTPVVTSAPIVTSAPVVTSAPAATSSFNYESVYDVFGGKDATNDLIAQIRGMGLSEAQIVDILTPYIPATSTPATTAAPVTTAQAELPLIETPVTPERKPLTCTASRLFSGFPTPVPNWPYRLAPQHLMTFETIAQVW
jgi:hypothetical protein